MSVMTIWGTFSKNNRNKRLWISQVFQWAGSVWNNSYLMYPFNIQFLLLLQKDVLSQLKNPRLFTLMSSICFESRLVACTLFWNSIWIGNGGTSSIWRFRWLQYPVYRMNLPGGTISTWHSRMEILDGCRHVNVLSPALLEAVKASSYRRHTTMAWCRQPSPASSQPCTTRSTTSATATFSSTAVVILPEQTMKLLRACTTACSCKKSWKERVIHASTCIRTSFSMWMLSVLVELIERCALAIGPCSMMYMQWVNDHARGGELIDVKKLHCLFQCFVFGQGSFWIWRGMIGPW